MQYRDKSDEILVTVNRCKVDLIKEIYEANGIYLGETKNIINYKNYLDENPIVIHVGGPSTLTGDPNITVGSGAFTGKSTAEKMQMCGITSSSQSGSETESRGLIGNVTVKTSGGTQTIKMNKAVHADLQAISEEICNLGWYNLRYSSWFRQQNSVKNGVSKHCWGVAVDINAGSSGNPWFDHRFGRNEGEPPAGSTPPWRQKMCPYKGVYDRSRCIWHYGHAVVKIFEGHGWGWGGFYGDVMHFSLFDGK